MAVAIGAVGLLVLVADLRAVDHLRRERPQCVKGVLPPVTALEVSLSMRSPVLRAGDRTRGEALVTNRSARPVRLLHADALLVRAGSTGALGARSAATFRPVDLGPGTFTTVPFVVHLARCRDDAVLVPGFYEVVLLLVEQEGSVVRVRRSAGRAIVLSP